MKLQLLRSIALKGQSVLTAQIESSDEYINLMEYLEEEVTLNPFITQWMIPLGLASIPNFFDVLESRGFAIHCSSVNGTPKHFISLGLDK